MPSSTTRRRLLQAAALLLIFSLAGRHMESHALPQTLSGKRENVILPASRLPSSTPLNPTVALEPRGRVLLVSNSPEYLTDLSVLPGALYRDRVEGPFRIFYHHANRARGSLTIATAITNVSPEPVVVYREAAGQGSNLYPDVAGQQAVRRYLASRGALEVVALLSPGASALVAPQTVAPSGTVSALQDFVALRAPRGPEARGGAAGAASPASDPSSLAAAEVVVTVALYRGAAPLDPASVAVVPAPPPRPVAGTPYYSLHRGTFPHGDRYGELSFGAGRDSFVLSVDSAAYGPYSSAMTGEYEVGSSAVDGLQGYINGNYGVVYTFRLELGSERSAREPYAFLIQPSGGSGHYTLEVNGDAVASPFVSHEGAWWFYNAVSYGDLDWMLLETSLPGGSYGPQKLFFVPDPVVGGARLALSP